LRHTDKSHLIEIVLETLSFNDIPDQIVESSPSARNAVGAKDLVIDIKPLSAAPAIAEWSIGRDEFRPSQNSLPRGAKRCHHRARTSKAMKEDHEVRRPYCRSLYRST
jgi:hypothetical protein